MDGVGYEGEAFAVLERSLAAAGRRVGRVIRPDRENRMTQDVDFLVEIDGQDVAIEVTRLALGHKGWNLVNRLEGQVQALLESSGKYASEWLVVYLDLNREFGYRETDLLAMQVASAILNVSPDAGVDRWADLDLEPEPAASTVSVSVRRLPGRQRISFVGGHEAAGGLIDERADIFVRSMLAKKRDQGAAYPEVWILVVDRDVLIDVEDLRGALARRAADVPSNWSTVHFIPATAPSTVLTIDLDSIRVA